MDVLETLDQSSNEVSDTFGDNCGTKTKEEMESFGSLISECTTHALKLSVSLKLHVYSTSLEIKCTSQKKKVCP